MTILYIGNQGDEGRAAVAVLRGAAPDAGVVWASHFDQAAHWLRAHADVAALVVEAWVGGQSCTAFLKEVRGAGVAAPIVIIAPEPMIPRLEPLRTRGYEFVARNGSLVPNLRTAASQAIERARTRRLSDMEVSFRQQERSWAIERAKSAELEQKLAQAAAARQDAERLCRLTIESTAAQLAERQAKYEASAAQAAAARQMVEEELREAATLLARARQDHSLAAAEVDRLKRREEDLTAQLADARSAAEAAEQRFRDETAAHESRLAGALADEAAARRDLELRLSEKAANLERELADARSAAEAAEQRFRDETAARRDLELRLNEKAATLERELADARSAAEAAEQRFRDETAAASALAHQQTARLEDQIALEKEALADAAAARQDLERRLSERAATLERELADARSAAEAAEQRFRDEAAAAGALAQERHQALAHERDAFHQALDKAQQDHEEATRNLRRTLERMSDDHAGALADRTRAIGELEERIRATLRELDVTRSRRDSLQAEVDLIPQLQAQLEEHGAEARRQFEHSPMALCRCTRAGALIRANQAFAALAGYRRPDQLHNTDFAATLFESPDDLPWLIDRCVSTRASESIETIWKGKNGQRLVVRVSAFASLSDVIEIGVEDLTEVRALEERLEQAHRMEAVGWLGSEVAVTCGNLLRDVQQNAQQWLAAAGPNKTLRRQVEMVLKDVKRAAGFLRELAAYSDEEIRGLVPVDLNKALRDLEPVLKRVAGDAVELEFLTTSSPLEVDIKAERLERLLVNLASYGRERLSRGGRLSFDLDTAVVDRAFLEKYPNVRQGRHALITVKEAMPVLAPFDPHAPEKPGVDLGALQRLISECGGHLWMKVGPPGEMVVKIHLPLAESDGQSQARISLIRNRRSLLSRWFRH